MSGTGFHATEETVHNADKLRKRASRFTFAALLAAGVLVWAGLSYWLIDRTGLFAAQCDVVELQAAAVAEDKVAAGLAELAEACLQRGLEEGDGEAMVAAIAGLRVSAEEASSAESALTLARLYDPNLREELLATASSSALIPDASALESVRFYDLAARNGDPDAQAMASVLRKAFSIPEPGVAKGGGALPILREDGTGLYRRVLLKPGGILLNEMPKNSDALSIGKAKQPIGASAGAPDAGDEGEAAGPSSTGEDNDQEASPQPSLGDPAGALDIQYVFTEQDGWLEIGRNVRTSEASRKWIRSEDTVEWGHMLGLRYKVPGKQGRVVFFESKSAANNALDREDLPEFHDFLTKRASETELAEAGVIALEDQSYPWALTKYVMPITDFERVERDGQNLTMVKVASIAGWSNPDVVIPDAIGAVGERSARVQTVEVAASETQRFCEADSFADFRHQVVFVIDTTISMGPYIEGVKRIAARWQSEIGRRGLEHKFRFGVVGYRNNMDEPPQAGRLEYVRRNYLTLGSGANVGSFAQKVQSMRPANVSTHDFDEDVAAGLDAALSFDWSNICGTKQIFLITDAGALDLTDPKGMFYNRSTGLTSLRGRAETNRIKINVVHLQTPEARAAGNVGSAAETYRLLAPGRYTYIPDGSRSEFDKYLQGVGAIIEAADSEAQNIGVDRSSLSANASLPSEMILNDLFAVQQNFLGQLAGSQVPVFVDLWTSDRDLADPDDAALEIGVMLTRDQLSQLARQIDSLREDVEAERSESGSFFQMLQIISAGTSSDPIAVTMQAADEASLGDRLPSWLNALPYQSRILAIDEESWRSMSDAQQAGLVARLAELRAYYGDREDDSASWISFEGDNNRSDVTFIPIDWMP